MSVARAVFLALSLSSAAGASAQESLKIQHQPPQCLVPDRYSELRAKIDPISNVLRARILFRTDPLAEPHAVLMRQDGQEFVGVLPRPLPTLTQVQYWVEAADPALVETVSDEVTVPVQASCAQAAKNKKSARTDVTAPLGAPLVPAGFGSDEQVADATFMKGGSGRAGVFNIGAKTSLIAALGVGAGAVAVAAANNPGGNPPERPVVMEPVGVTFIESTPAPGGTVSLGQGSFRVMVRVVIGSGIGGAPSIEFRQNPGGPVCMTNAFQLPNEFLEPHVGRNVQFNQFRATGACGDTFEVGVVRVALRASFGAGAEIFTTGTAEVPDLALRYLVTP